jgi:hypothetical protein
MSIPFPLARGLAVMIVTLSALGAHGTAAAADPVTDALQSAWAPMRAALFRTNQKAQPESEQALAEARTRWQALVDRFGAQPPVPYAGDRAFSGSLAKVGDVLAKAEAQARAGKLETAHVTLEQAREVMADLRRRNGVVTFTDHMDAYHAQMEQVQDGTERMLSQPGGLLLLAAETGVLDHLARRLRNEAPLALSENPEFETLTAAVEGSVAALREAIRRQDPMAARAAVARLKAPYARLFVKFG